MNKELKERLDNLENELKESKKEIHKLKGSVSFIVENGIRRILSRFTKKQIVLGSLIVLFSVSIIGIAGTVTKTYTFSAGEVVSASKFNTNFDTLFNLVNGNLDDANISGISASKIIDNISSEKILSQDNDSIIFFSTRESYNGNLGGRSGADLKCKNHIDRQITRYLSPCQNVRAVLSISASDEVRDMKSNFSIPDNFTLRDTYGLKFADSWDNYTGSNLLIYPNIPIGVQGHVDQSNIFWSSTNNNGSYPNYDSNSLSFDYRNCNGYTSSSESINGYGGKISVWITQRGHNGAPIPCNKKQALLCICW